MPRDARVPAAVSIPCLIVAAGQGTRLREKGGLKPLIPLRGTPLIGHVIARAQAAGITEFLVVTGYRGDELAAALDGIASRLGVGVTTIGNPEWTRANGASVLAAAPRLAGPFLLTMCDHLIDPAILRSLMAIPTDPETVTLAIDSDIDNPRNDPDDVTRVRHADGFIRAIGKSLSDFNAIDTGAFLCTDAMFGALRESRAAGDDSISGAMNVLARRERARVHDIGGRLWMDVDDPVAFAHAERLLDEGRL